jgi:hypothetical protein
MIISEDELLIQQIDIIKIVYLTLIQNLLK